MNNMWQRSRKEYVCYRCERIIKKGELYYRKYIIASFRPPKSFCLNCGVIASGDRPKNYYRSRQCPNCGAYALYGDETGPGYIRTYRCRECGFTKGWMWHPPVTKVEEIKLAPKEEKIVNGALAELALIEKKRGCFIATAAYGTPFAREIRVLRDFRDKVLCGGRIDLSFAKFYYSVSPTLANFIERRDTLRSILRCILEPITHICTIVLREGKSYCQLPQKEPTRRARRFLRAATRGRRM